MPRTKLLVSALALALAGTSTAQAQEFSAVISFGDSLTDAGNVALIDGNPFTPPGSSFTTNPDPVYAELVAQAFGYPGTNSLSGGYNYAFGGACVRANSVSFTCGLSPGSFSLTNQLGGYLASVGGQADPNALYTMWGGANDIFTYAGLAGAGIITSAQAQQFTGVSAATMVGLIGTLQNAGAQHIVVFNLPDLGATPQAAALGAQASFAGLTFVYNSTLNGGLATLPDGIIPINVFGLVNEVIGDPSTYGFSNVTGTACGVLSGSLACGPAGDIAYLFHYAAGTNTSYLFADGVHPTGGAHAILANVVVATIHAPGQVSMAGELPLQIYDNHAATINGQIFGMSRTPRDPGESNVYGQLQYSRADYEATANTGEFDSNIGTATLGADVRYTDNISLGVALSFGGTRGDSSAHSIDAKEVLASAYGVAHWNSGYVNLILSGGSSSFDIDRAIVMGPHTRIENGDTSASHVAFEIGGGFAFGGDDFRHGPYLSHTYQKVDVRAYQEDSLDSTSMWFEGFNRRSSVSRVGYQAQGHMGSFHPYGRVAYARDRNDNTVSVQAGSNTMNGHFTFDGFIPGDNWYEADVGLEYSINDNTELSFAWRGRLNDEAQDVNTVMFGARWEFAGVAPAPEPEAVVEPVAASCADMDDDGDGVNNCEDKCPGSPAGEGVGADGCAVPATEPEPAMEPQPYRN